MIYFWILWIVPIGIETDQLLTMVAATNQLWIVPIGIETLLVYWNSSSSYCSELYLLELKPCFLAESDLAFDLWIVPIGIETWVWRRVKRRQVISELYLLELKLFILNHFL